MSVAVVTGAARGVGRGIARALGERGDTVYVVDRESRDRRYSELAGTVQDTAEQVDALGGRGVPVVLDLAASGVDDALAALFDRVIAEDGGADVVVANAANGNALPFGPAPFWELAHQHWANMMEVGVHGHLRTARAAVPALRANAGVLVFTGYDPPPDTPADSPLGGHVVYDLAMAAVRRLTTTVAHDLRSIGVDAVCLSPGFTRTEAIEAALGADHPALASADPLGRVGAALLRLIEDPRRADLAGTTRTVAELTP